MRRRTLIRWVPVAALVFTSLFATAALPATSHALSPIAPDACIQIYPAPPGCQAPAPKLASLNHIGWTYLNLNYCPAGMFCAAVYRDSMLAYQYTSSGWRETQLSGGWVYVYPYGSGYRWAWTQRSGWVAVSGGRFELRAF